jgi:3-ketosteroid 9alpha-monooxygenase subunit A
MMGRELAVGEVKPLRYFSKDLAMWRGEDGQVRVTDAYCKHLGAHMGHGGKVHGNLLECPFHAWRYDGEEGVVKDIPYAKAIPPQVKRKCTRTWPVTEANRWIWVWYHPEERRADVDVVVPEASDPEWTGYDMHEWKSTASIQNMAENGVDVAHFKYIHGTAELPKAELRWGDWGRGADVQGARWARPMGDGRRADQL